MKIVLAGGSGFLGRPLASRLALSGHEVVVFTRNVAVGRAAKGIRYITWNPDGTVPEADREHGVDHEGRLRRVDWASELDGADAVVNMSGAGIADERWTKARKNELRQSRVESTRGLIAAIRDVARRPGVFLQASAIGYYGDTGDTPVDESSPAGSDFLAGLCAEWEAEGHAAATLGCRVVTLRTGIVLAPDGGALKKMAPPFRAFVGGRMGSGRQFMSWIHLNDWISMAAWAIENPEVTGVVNGTAPKPVTNAMFAQALGQALHRPSVFPVPGFVLRVLVGEMADVMLLTGQRVIPKRALDLKFGFRYPDITLAMNAVYPAI